MTLYVKILKMDLRVAMNIATMKIATILRIHLGGMKESMKYIIASDSSYHYCDDEDYEYLNSFKWTSVKGYVFRRLDRSNVIYLHQEVAKRMGMILEDGEEIDHKDRNRSNNQRNNLRPASDSQAAVNRTKRGTVSKYKGLKSKKNGKWEVSCGLNGVEIYIGVFNTQEEAARAYDRSAKRLHGEFAVLNFPGE